MDPTRMIDFYTNAFYISMAIAILGAIVTVVIFIRMDIWKIIGELTGRTQRKEMEAIVASNNRTDALGGSGELPEAAKVVRRHSGLTGRFRFVGSQNLNTASIADQAAKPETMPLDQAAAAGLVTPVAQAAIHFKITESIVVIHTTEKIAL